MSRGQGAPLFADKGCLPIEMSCDPFRRAFSVSTGREGWSLVRGSKKKGPGLDEWRQQKRHTVGAFSFCAPPMCQRLASQCSPFTPSEEEGGAFHFDLSPLKERNTCLFWTEWKDPGMKRQLPRRHWQEKQRFWNPSVYNNKGEKERSLYCSLQSLLSWSNSH